MIDLHRPWPREIECILENLQPSPNGDPNCYVAEVDLSEEQVKILNLFQGAARHEHVFFHIPATSQSYLGYLHTPIGLGAPHDPAGHVARVRIALTEVEPH
jgi:hypothetical protein